MGLIVGQADLLGLAGSRFESITGTKYSHVTASNLARIAEYNEVINRIATAPWFGHGLGYAFSFREPIGFKILEQWYSHQSYLLVLLKQGVIGLLALLWTLWAAVTFGIHESRRNEDPLESAWLATAAVCTVFVAVLDLSNFHLNVVNTVFPLAFLWGAAMAIGRQGFIRFQWADRAAPSPPTPKIS